MRKLLIGTGVTALLLTGCLTSVPPSADETTVSSSSSSVAAQWVSFEGTVQKLGVNVFMEGTHRLVTDNGQEALLESDTVVLDDYVDAKVRLTGLARATVEGEAIIINVDGIERVLTDDEPSVLEESSSESSESSSSSSEAMSSSSSSLVASVSSSVASLPRSSSSSVRAAVSSPPQIAEEAPSSAPAAGASFSAMAKAKVDSANFTQQYCTTHIGFCVPVHRNWFFVSFGANVSPSLWHVEMSDKEIEEVGQGAIVVDLVSGALSGEAEGTAMPKGDNVVAYRQWTGNRHFEVSGPASLKAAIEYIAQNLTTAQ